MTPFALQHYRYIAYLRGKALPLDTINMRADFYECWSRICKLSQSRFYREYIPFASVRFCDFRLYRPYLIQPYLEIINVMRNDCRHYFAVFLQNIIQLFLHEIVKGLYVRVYKALLIKIFPD